MSAKMNGDLGIEFINSNSEELKWKPVKKGRSSRKSSGRCLNGASKFADCDRLKEFGDFPGSDSDKIGENPPGQSSLGMLENVPIKKRRHLLCKDSNTEDFSGIELLAAAASMSKNSDCNKETSVDEDLSLKLVTSDASGAALLPEIGLKCNEPGDSSNNMTGNGGSITCSLVASDSACASQSLNRSTQGGILSKKMSRKHWDLNVQMDAWDEPNDSVAALKAISDNINIEKDALETRDDANASAGTSYENSNMILDKSNSAIASPDSGTNLCGIEGQPGSCSFNSNAGTNNKGCEDEFCGRTAGENLCRDSVIGTIDAVSKHDCSVSSEPCCTSSAVVCEKTGGICDVPKSFVSSRDVSDCERTGNSENTQSGPRIGVLLAEAEPADLKRRDSKDSCSFVQDGHSLPFANSNASITIDSACTENQDHSVRVEFVPGHEDKNHPSEESKTAMMDGLSKSINTGVPDGPSLFDEVLDSAKFTQQDSDGDSLTACKDERDSLYEDGELRGSYMHFWKENDCFDYESDGRNEDGAYVDLSELAEGGSEISHGTDKGNSMLKGNPEADENKNRHGKLTPTKNFVTEVRDNDEIAGKGSNAGSGTTVENSIENIEENGDSRKRRPLTGRSDANGKTGVMNEFSANMSRREFRFRTEGRSSCRSHRHDRSASRVRDGAQWTSWSSRMRQNSDYQLLETHYPSKPRHISSDSARGIGDRRDFLDSRQADGYLLKGLQRPIRRCPYIKREEYTGVRKRMPLAQGGSKFRDRGDYLHHADRGFKDFVRFPPSLPMRDQSFSPDSGRSSYMHLPRKRARSISRSRSPSMWHARREPTMTRRRIRSPDNRNESRMCSTTRVPFFKPSFAASYDEGFRFSNDSSYPESHSKRRRSSPARIFRHPPQWLDPIHSPGRSESNEYCRPGYRNRRLPFVPTSKGRKLDTDYNGRSREGVGTIR